MAFRFALAAVLRIRESIESREERMLQTIQLEVSRLENQADAIRRAIADKRETREGALRHCVSGGQLHSWLWEEQSAERELLTALAQLQTAEQQRDEQRKVYQVAHRDREMLTEMFEKQKRLYDQERARDEQKKLDDLFLMRRLRG